MKVSVIARGNEIIIKPVVEVPREQAWFWDREWMEKEKNAESDQKDGRTTSFATVDEALAWLKS